MIWAVWMLACIPVELRPTGPVLSAGAASTFVGSAPDVHYTGPPRSPVPILPVMPWGAHYELDLVVRTRHPDWNMHELSQVATPDGLVWLAKDAPEPSLSQSVVVDRADIEAWLPELPVPKAHGPVLVDDRSSDRRLDLTVGWTNADGVPMEVDYRGPRPTLRTLRRNGSTMGHSPQLLATLDLPRRNLASRAEVRYDGEVVPLRRIRGLVPFALALTQTQGGLAGGTWTTRPLVGGGQQTVFLGEGRPVAVDWRPVDGGLEARDELRTLRAIYGPDGRELQRLEVWDWQRKDPLVVVRFQPALPDLTRPFEGEVRGDFVIDTNGQAAHAVGAWTARSEEDEATLALTPLEPWWVVDRPMRTRIDFAAGRPVRTSVEVGSEP